MTQPTVTAKHLPDVATAPIAEATSRWLATTVGVSAIGFSLLYLASDIIEVVQRGFSTERLVLTYIGEAAIPLFVLGLYSLQRPAIGRLGLLGAVAYSYAYVFFTSTVMWALVARATDYDGVTDAFGAWMLVHGAIMLIGGVAFGVAVVRAQVLPRWTGICCAAGVVLVAAASGLPVAARTLAEAVTAVAFIGMGYSLLTRYGRDRS
ncbi:MAG: conserved rane protein of unknown function [Pseudonocardiales bacterium]|nr:conserved rane protein of unknown function [Jatrophihabitantaceae bacterium]MCW2604996.1 conserved rane protein of unknown function [Pseudonocardiales bacterium]